jgi:hypothetical protein
VAADQSVEVGNLVHVLELVERDERAVAAALLEPKREVEERVQRRQGSNLVSSWSLALIPNAPSERPMPVFWRNSSILVRIAPLRCLEYARSNRTVTSAIDDTR